MGTKYYLRFGYRFNDYEPLDSYQEAEAILVKAMRAGEPECTVYECRDNVLKPIREAWWSRNNQDGVDELMIRNFNTTVPRHRVVPDARPVPYESSSR